MSEPLFNDLIGIMAVILMVPVTFLWLERKTRWKIFNLLPAIIWIFLTPIFLSNFGVIPRTLAKEVLSHHDDSLSDYSAILRFHHR